MDRGALARLVSSISRFLDPQAAWRPRPARTCRCWTAGAWAGRGCWTRSWARLGIGAAIRRVAQARRVDGRGGRAGDLRAGGPTGVGAGPANWPPPAWVTERVFIEHLPTFSDDQAYRAMDFLLEALEEIAAEVFASVATLLNLQVDLVLAGFSGQSEIGESFGPENHG